MDLLHLLYTV